MDLDNIKELIMGFVLVSLIAASGAIALSGLQSDVKTDKTSTRINETITTGSVLDQGGRELFIGASACRNASMIAITIGLECNVSSIGLITLNAANFSDNNAFIDYTYYTPSHIINITNDGLMGIDNTTSYFGTAGTIAGVALLLTIVLGAFYFVTRRVEP